MPRRRSRTRLEKMSTLLFVITGTGDLPVFLTGTLGMLIGRKRPSAFFLGCRWPGGVARALLDHLAAVPIGRRCIES